MVEELSGEELVLVLLAVSETGVALVKIRLPGTVRGLFTVANTGAGLGWIQKGKEGGASVYCSSLHQCSLCSTYLDRSSTVYSGYEIKEFPTDLPTEQHLSHLGQQILFIIFEVLWREISQQKTWLA